MENLVLVSDDKDFFCYINNLLKLQESDNSILMSFDEVINNFHLLQKSILLIDSESSQERTLDLLQIFKYLPVIVIAYNYNENYKIKCYEKGAFAYLTLLEAESELKLRMISAFKWQALLSRNYIYHSILNRKNIIAENNNIYTDYNDLLDVVLDEIKSSEKNAVFMAISPDDKSKYLINENQLQTTILNNVKQSDIVINYAVNKYFVMMFDVGIVPAQNFWNGVFSQLPQKIYSVFCPVSNQTRETLVNEALNKLYQAINQNDFRDDINSSNSIKPIEITANCVNFKTYKQHFIRNFNNIVTPVFYHYQQKYNSILNGFKIKQNVSDGKGYFNIEGQGICSSMQISSPGFSKINIDIVLKRNKKVVESKRITLEPSEMEQGVLNDIMEQYFIENKSYL